MSALKDQDPDYGPPAASNEKHQRIYEENARSSTTRKITAIVEKEFSQEIATKETEVLEVQERLHKALKTLHLLRYVVVADFYGRKQCHNNQVGEAKQTQIHPAIKQLIGKSPKIYDIPSLPSTSGHDSQNCNLLTDLINNSIKQENPEENAATVEESGESKNDEDEPRPRKIPRYVPPKSSALHLPDPSRNVRHKVRKRIIVGNISKWIPPDWREDAASHKWTVYVRGNKENPDIDDFVGKVRFFLHPSYRPNDVVEVTSAPFCLSRRGWGEFPVRVQLHFKNAFDKPMDIIHHLKLDRTYTGLQTLGSETLVDIWIYGDSKQSKRSTAKEDQNATNGDENLKLLDRVDVKDECSGAATLLNSADCIPLSSTFSNDDVDPQNMFFKSMEDKLLSMVTEKEVKPENQVSIKSEPADIDLEFSMGVAHPTSLESQYSNRNIESIHNNYEGLNIGQKPSVITIDQSLKIYDKTSIKYETIDTFESQISHKDYALSPSTSSSTDINSLQSPWNQMSHIERLRLSVSLDHDYLSLGDVAKVIENNFTIDHSIDENPSSSIKAVSYDEKIVAQNPWSIESGKDNFLINTIPRKLDSSINRITTNISPKLQEAAFQPLKISIPPPFEPKANKRVLVLQDDKTIPVDISSSSRSATKSGISARPKINFSVGRGLSLLKKPLNVKSGETKGNSSHCLNGNLTNTPSLKIDSSVSVLLNVNSNIPTLKIAETRQSTSKEVVPSVFYQPTKDHSMYKVEENQEPAIRNKVTLGKDKHKIQARKDTYENVFQTIEHVKIADALGLLRFIIRRLPMITTDATDPEYRRLHPYACKSEEEFFGYNVARRKALEWNRAAMVRDFLNRKIAEQGESWTVKEILIWARFHGYTPICSSFTFNLHSQCKGAKQLPDSESVGISMNEGFCTSTLPIAFHKWLTSCPAASKNIPISTDVQQLDAQDIIDVEHIDTMELAAKKRRDASTSDAGCAKGDSKISVLELNKNLMPLHEFVYETAHQIGVKLVPEEIVPSVMHCAASRVVMRAVECFVDDLVRGSLAKAWERHNGNGYPKVVTLEDVRKAILNREEFDLFTNDGLGSNYRSMLVD